MISFFEVKGLFGIVKTFQYTSVMKGKKQAEIGSATLA
jgi:hypothetical protein